MHISTEQVVGQLDRAQGMTSQQIVQKLDEMQRSTSLFMPDDAKRAARNTLGLINSEFNGDARAAVDFLKQNANDPRLKGQDYNQFVESGQAQKFVQSVRGPAQGGPIPVSAPAQTASPPQQTSSLSTATPGFNPYAQPLNTVFASATGQKGWGINFDRQGRLDLNGDGVGGIPGIVKSLIEGATGMRMSNTATTMLAGSTPGFQSVNPTTGLMQQTAGVVGGVVGGLIVNDIKTQLQVAAANPTMKITT